MTQNNPLKNLVRREVAARRSLSPVRDALWLSLAKRDRAAVLSIGKKLNLQPLLMNDFSISDSKPNETLFILGSGYSINELSVTHFEEIRNHISVGINVWIAHDFIPDAYSLEPRTLPMTPLAYEQNRYRAEKLNRVSVIKASPKFLVLRPPSPSVTEQFVAIPEVLRDRAFLYGRVNLPQVKEEIANYELKRFLNAYLQRQSNLAVLPDNGASVIRLVFLGLKLGFQRVVLVGVDLNQDPYFWYHPDWLDKRPELAALFPRPIGVPHDTLQKKREQTNLRPYDTSEVIRSISEAMESSHQARLFVGSRSSALADHLPLYPWQG